MKHFKKISLVIVLILALTVTFAISSAAEDYYVGLGDDGYTFVGMTGAGDEYGSIYNPSATMTGVNGYESVYYPTVGDDIYGEAVIYSKGVDISLDDADIDDILTYSYTVATRGKAYSSFSLRIYIPDFVSVTEVTQSEKLSGLSESGVFEYSVSGNEVSVSFSSPVNFSDTELFSIEFTVNDYYEQRGYVDCYDYQFVNENVETVYATIDLGYISIAEKVVMGDVNGDEIVNLADLLIIQRSIVNYDYPLNETQYRAADIDKNGEVDMRDCQYIQNYLVGRLESLDDVNSSYCDHKYTYTAGEDASCTEPSYYKVICKDCGKTVDDGYMDAPGHDYDEYGCCVRCGYYEGEYGDLAYAIEEAYTYAKTEWYMLPERGVATTTIRVYQAIYKNILANIECSESFEELESYMYEFNNLIDEIMKTVQETEPPATETEPPATETEPPATETEPEPDPDAEVRYVFETNVEGMYVRYEFYTDRMVYAYITNPETGEINKDSAEWGYTAEGYVGLIYDGEFVQVFTVNDDGFTLTLVDTPAVGCNHRTTVSGGRDATCTESGYKETICQECKEVLDKWVVPAYGHMYDESGYCVNCGESADGIEEISIGEALEIGSGLKLLIVGKETYAVTGTVTEGNSEYGVGLFRVEDENGYGIYIFSVADGVEIPEIGATVTIVGYPCRYLCDSVQFPCLSDVSVLYEGAEGLEITPIADVREVTCQLYPASISTDEEYILTGTVTEIVNTKYGNMYITDDSGCSIYIYGLYDANGNRYIDMDYQPQVGDVITVQGAITKYVDGPDTYVIEIKNAVLLNTEGSCEHEKQLETITEATCTDNGYYKLECTSCGEVLKYEMISAAYGHELGADGACVNCGYFKGDELAMLIDKAVANAEAEWNGLFDKGVSMSTIATYEAQYYAILERMQKSASVEELEANMQEFNAMIEQMMRMIERPTECAHDKVYSTGIAGTCTDGGVMQVVCEECGVIISEEHYPAAGHLYGEDGSCVNCGYYEIEDMPEDPVYTYTSKELTLWLNYDYTVEFTELIYEADGSVTKIAGTNKWYEADGKIYVYTDTSEYVFTVTADGELTPYEEGGEVVTPEVNDYVYYYESDELTIYLYEDYTANYTGEVRTADGALYEIEGTGEWYEMEDGGICVFVETSERTFTVSEWGELTPYEEAKDVIAPVA